MPIKDPVLRRKSHNEYMKKYLSIPENRDKHMERIRRNSAANSDKISAVIAEFRLNGCLVCKEKSSCCMHAHHLDPSQKEISIGNAKRLGYPAKRIIEELSKCVCLCANCHAKVHAGEITL